MTSTLFKRPRVVTSEEEEEEEEYSTCLSFAEIFSSLAHHFFPDGAPAEYSETYPHGGSWPRRMDRNIISAEEARSSIYNLSSFSRQNGISPREMYAVSLVACATLPQERNQQSNVLTNSKLVDGTSKYFVLLVKCLIPSPLGSEKKDEECIPAQVISMLFSAAASISCDIPGKCAVLRFLVRVYDVVIHAFIYLFYVQFMLYFIASTITSILSFLSYSFLSSIDSCKSKWLSPTR